MTKRYLFMLMLILVLPGVKVYAIGAGPVDIHGFITQGYLKSTENNYFADTKNGSFQYNEMGLNFSSKLSPKLRTGLQFFAHDFGDLGNDEVTLDWVFGDYRWREWLGLRVGKIKNPLGLYNEVRDVDVVRTFVNLPQSIYSEKYRESWMAIKGAGLYGKVGSDSLGALGYQFQMGSMETSKESGVAKHLESFLGFYRVTDDFDTGLAYAGKIEWQTPVIPLRLAGSILRYDFSVPFTVMDGIYLPISEVEVDVDDLLVAIGSMELSYEKLIVAFEYSEIGIDGVLNSPYGPLQSVDNTLQGYYGSITYRFYSWFELGAYYSVYYPDKSDKKGEDMFDQLPFKKDFQAWSKDVCFTARFDIKTHWICKLEGHVINGAADLLDMDNYDKDTPIVGNMPVLDIEEDWMLFAVKMCYFF